MHHPLVRGIAVAIALAATTASFGAEDKPAAPVFEPNGTVHVPAFDLPPDDRTDCRIAWVPQDRSTRVTRITVGSCQSFPHNDEFVEPQRELAFGSASAVATSPRLRSNLR